MKNTNRAGTIEVEIDWTCEACYEVKANTPIWIDRGDYSQELTLQAAQVKADELGEAWGIQIKVLSGAAQDIAVLQGTQENIEYFLEDYFGYSASDVAWVIN